MSSRKTAGIGIMIAGLLIAYAIINPGEEPENPGLGVFSLAGTAVKSANGAALGGQVGTQALGVADLSDEELQALLDSKLAEATAEAQAELQRLLPEYLANASSDAQAELKRLLPQYLSQASAGAQAELSRLAQQYLAGNVGQPTTSQSWANLTNPDKIRTDANALAEQLGALIIGSLAPGAGGTASKSVTAGPGGSGGTHSAETVDGFDSAVRGVGDELAASMGGGQ
ncbi:MAG: hypothetical protein ACT4OM_10090 [Actinomycetota bacterium]